MPVSLSFSSSCGWVIIPEACRIFVQATVGFLRRIFYRCATSSSVLIFCEGTLVKQLEKIVDAVLFDLMNCLLGEETFCKDSKQS